MITHHIFVNKGEEQIASYPFGSHSFQLNDGDLEIKGPHPRVSGSTLTIAVFARGIWDYVGIEEK